MKCRNCETNLRTDFQFCPGCGAKLETKRISFKRLLGDLADRVFSLDNSFTRTFLTLFTHPENVIGGYISGVRKKFMNPLSYMGIALTLSGLIVFLIQKFFADKIDLTGISSAGETEFSRSYQEFVYDYSSLLFILYIPVMALPAYLVFNKVRYNLAEHFVVFTYILAQYSLVSFPVSVILLLTTPENYMVFSLPLLFLTLLYSLFALQRLNRYQAPALIGRSIIYNVLMMIFLFALSFGILGLLLVSGVFELKDLVPPKA
jgi:hypothetical protein